MASPVGWQSKPQFNSDNESELMSTGQETGSGENECAGHDAAARARQRDLVRRGAEMFWDHEGTAAYLEWLAAAGLAPRWHRFIPEGTSGHTLVLAQSVPARVEAAS